MKRLRQALRRFFFPPPGSRLWIRILPYSTLGVLTLAVFIAGAYAWDYTNSPAFCGTTCHTMPPEYTAYLTSPHARIDCVDCHIGKGFIATRITRKAGDLRHILATAFKTYQFPIIAKDLRPARETCEKCHSPEKFSDDSLRQILHFADDRNNTATTTYLVLKTGGGSKRLGLGKGIHWHIENPVYYLATDPEEQTIPYVRVVNDDGSITEYTDVTASIDSKAIDPSQLKVMDCITCHNRVTHMIYPPEDSVDQLLARGVISPSVPEIRRKAVEALRGTYATATQALQAIADLQSFYATTYPEFASAHPDLIQAAIAALQDDYTKSVFSDQKADWNSHPNNVGHDDSPGCFRCHDGKHLSPQQQAIRLECNLCHSIPVVVGPDRFVADIEVSRGPEPQSHLNPNWIALHRDAFDATCSDCHDTSNPGGTDNSSFCSNSACHGTEWKYAGLDAPKLRAILAVQLPTAPTPTTAAPTPSPGGRVTYEGAIGPLFSRRCGSCHAGPNGIKGLDLTTYAGAIAGGQDGPVIVPGDAQGSLLIQKQSGAQPHFSQLTPDELQMVVNWIASGAQEK